MIATILVAVDGSARSAGVFDASAELARAMHSRLVLFRALVIPPDFGPAGGQRAPDPLPAFLETEARAQLASLMGRAPDVVCEVRIEVAVQPWRAIVEAGERVQADLIVLGSHGYHGWDHVLGTTAGKVANLAQRNVMVVHERSLSTAPQGKS